MGWFSKFLGSGRTKEDMIRSLVKNRLAGDVLADAIGAIPEAINEAPPEMIWSLPEATIVAIVEAWAQGRSRQIPEKQIFQFIEAHRSKAVKGELSASPTLISYLRYRIDLEHAHAHPPLSGPHIKYCMNEAIQFFGPVRD